MRSGAPNHGHDGGVSSAASVYERPYRRGVHTSRDSPHSKGAHTPHRAHHLSPAVASRLLAPTGQSLAVVALPPLVQGRPRLAPAVPAQRRRGGLPRAQFQAGQGLRYPMITSPDQTSVGMCVCISWFYPPLPLVDCIITIYVLLSLVWLAILPQLTTYLRL